MNQITELRFMLAEIVRLDESLPATVTPDGLIVNLSRAYLRRAAKLAREALALTLQLGKSPSAAE